MITPETSPPVGQVELSPPLVPPHFAMQLLLARGCFSISSILSAVILARGLGPIEYGVYGVIISVLTWIELD